MNPGHILHVPALMAALIGRHLLYCHLFYCHLFEGPESGVLRLDALVTPVRSAMLLGCGVGEVVVDRPAGPAIQLPGTAPDSLLPVVAVELAAAPEVEVLPYTRQASDHSVTLRAADALIQGAAGKPVARLEGDHLGWWSSMDDSLWFHFLMERPHEVHHTGGTAEKKAGTFEVILDHACADAAGGELEIRLLDRVIKVAVDPTGGWTGFRSESINRITICQSGLLALLVRPLAIRGQGLVNLRSVTLRPAGP